MVTGLEAVGVALVILPLLVNQLDNYARGAEKVRALRRPRRTLRKYALDIGTQYTVFLNSLEELLDGVIDNADKIRELINNPQGGLWRDASLQERLKARLGRSHEVFMANVLFLNDSLIRLSEKLGVDLSNGFNPAGNSVLKVSRWKILSTAVYDDLLGSIVKANDTSHLEGHILGLVGAHPKSHYLMTVIQGHELQIAWYGQILDAIIPTDPAITRPSLWHNDLHDDNIFIDLNNTETITGIIDWQSCHVSPLFNHNVDPAFIDWDGLEPEILDLAPWPNLSGLSPEESSAAIQDYTIQNMFIGWLFIGWRKPMHAKNHDLYRVVGFRKTAAYGLIFLAHRIFEYGEAHFQSLVADLEDTWKDLPAIASVRLFPFHFSEAEYERIKEDSDCAVAGTELVVEAKERLGNLWPDKGFIEHERYNECKAALDKIKGLILEQ
ncbi:hypothetical protein BJX62DRAFT_244210 [Aspergillus germanicus]